MNGFLSPVNVTVYVATPQLFDDQSILTLNSVIMLPYDDDVVDVKQLDEADPAYVQLVELPSNSNPDGDVNVKNTPLASVIAFVVVNWTV